MIPLILAVVVDQDVRRAQIGVDDLRAEGRPDRRDLLLEAVECAFDQPADVASGPR
jgi:hypothetical protein